MSRTIKESVIQSTGDKQYYILPDITDAEGDSFTVSLSSTLSSNFLSYDSSNNQLQFEENNYYGLYPNTFGSLENATSSTSNSVTITLKDSKGASREYTLTVVVKAV